jgi:hypothetical protein
MRATSSGLAVAALVFASLAACGGDDEQDHDAAVVIDAPADIDAPAAPTCAAYCNSIAANCTGANLMYGTTAECMATCGLFIVGTGADMAGNTLGCRLYHANNAAGSMQNANTHCRHGGPGGDGLCGANCEGFCTIALGACSAQNPPPYANMGACMTACGNYATAPAYVATQTSGNSFACRLYHATAASANPGLHCAHTAMVSATCQ